MKEIFEVQCSNCNCKIKVTEEQLEKVVIRCPNTNCQKVYKIANWRKFALLAGKWLDDKNPIDVSKSTKKNAGEVYLNLDGYMSHFFSGIVNSNYFITAFREFVKSEHIDGVENATRLFNKIEAQREYEMAEPNFSQLFGLKLSAKEIETLEGKLKENLKEKLISRQTLINYFNGKNQPPYTQRGRHLIFAICFALKLNGEQARRFFETVYMDRIDSCLPEEVFYMYCLQNGMSYCCAKRMLVYYQYLNLKSEAPTENINQVNAWGTQFFVDALYDGYDFNTIVSGLQGIEKNLQFQTHRTVQMIMQYKADMHSDMLIQQEEERSVRYQEKYKLKSKNKIKKLLLKDEKAQKHKRKQTNAFVDILPREDYTHFFTETPVSYNEMNFFDIRNYLVLMEFWSYFFQMSQQGSAAKWKEISAFEFLDELDSTLGYYNMNPLNKDNLFDRFIICIALVAWKELNIKAYHFLKKERGQSCIITCVDEIFCSFKTKEQSLYDILKYTDETEWETVRITAQKKAVYMCIGQLLEIKDTQNSNSADPSHEKVQDLYRALRIAPSGYSDD